TLGPFQVELSSAFGHGRTEIRLPPFGDLTADTHQAPLWLRATLTDVELHRLTTTLSDHGLQGLSDEVEADAEARLRGVEVRVLLASAAGALALGVLAFRRDARRVAIATLTALVAVGG